MSISRLSGPSGGALPNVYESGGRVTPTGGSANTYGSYTQILASLTRKVTHLTLVLGQCSATAANQSIKIATGAGNDDKYEITMGADMINTTRDTGLAFTVPLEIPAGTRVSVSIKNESTGSAIMEVSTTFGGRV